MPKLITTIAAAAALAVSLTAMPANAASIQFGGAQVQDAQFSFGFSVGDRGFHRRGDDFYFNGHRGFRGHRDGYRFHNGYWFPPAAFSFGVTIDERGDRRFRDRGRDRGRMGGWDRHVAWCYDHYRSYRASDNTFQPYNGPRRACVSPYS